MQNIVGVVILYNPEKSVALNIMSYANKLDRLFIIDNSSERNDLFASLINERGLYLHDGKNEGIAKRLNQALLLAKSCGASFLLTMDQDSYFDPEDLDNYFLSISRFSNINSVGMFGIEHEGTSLSSSKSYEQNVILITSGSVINMKLSDAIGQFDETLFIDAVDDEYCLKILSKGFETVKFNHLFLHHHLGETKSFRSLKNLRPTKRVLHSPVRLYYMIRNNLYLKARYRAQFKDYFKTKQRDINNRIKNNLLYGKQKITTLKMIAKAYRDFKNNKMGKIQSRN